MPYVEKKRDNPDDFALAFAHLVAEICPPDGPDPCKVFNIEWCHWNTEVDKARPIECEECWGRHLGWFEQGGPKVGTVLKCSDPT